MLLKLTASLLVASCLAGPLHLLDQPQTRRFVCGSDPGVTTMRREEESSDFEIGLRSFLSRQTTHWPKGIVPFEVDTDFSAEQTKMIKQSMLEISSASCVRWVPRNKQFDFVRIIHHPSKTVCNAVVGRKGGMQELNLGDECFLWDEGYPGAITHEMMHIIGFIHEQQRLDRDCYVKVANQIIEEREFDYAITQDTDTQFPYDFGSLMHYGRSDYMSSHKGEQLGNYEGHLTYLDKMKLNYMYCGGPSYCKQHPTECAKLQAAQQACKINNPST